MYGLYAINKPYYYELSVLTHTYSINLKYKYVNNLTDNDRDYRADIRVKTFNRQGAKNAKIIKKTFTAEIKLSHRMQNGDIHLRGFLCVPGILEVRNL